MASLENQRLGIQCLWQKELSLPGLQFDADVVYSYLDFFLCVPTRFGGFFHVIFHLGFSFSF